MGMSPIKPYELEPSLDVEVRSPCNGICRLNLFDVCKGCKRTRAEISKWYAMSNEEKLAVLKRLK